jgi:hypothetical protein
LYRTGDVEKDVKLALDALFRQGQYVGAFFNATYTSSLSANQVDFKKSTNVVTVHLGGSFTKPKEDCDKLRYRAQVWETARQFPEVKYATIWVGNKLLGDLLYTGK